MYQNRIPLKIREVLDRVENLDLKSIEENIKKLI